LHSNLESITLAKEFNKLKHKTMTIQEITNTQNEIIENIFANKENFLKIYNNVLSKVLPTELKKELLNASQEEKRALMTYIISALSFELTLDKLN
jgi:hypothetical protein